MPNLPLYLQLKNLCVSSSLAQMVMFSLSVKANLPNGVIFKELLVLEFVIVQKFVSEEAKKVKRDAEALRSRICLSTRVPWIYKEKGVWNPPKNRETKILNFIGWIIVQKNIYRLRDLFKGLVKLDRQKNIF